MGGREIKRKICVTIFSRCRLRRHQKCRKAEIICERHFKLISIQFILIDSSFRALSDGDCRDVVGRIVWMQMNENGVAEVFAARVLRQIS